MGAFFVHLIFQTRTKQGQFYLKLFNKYLRFLAATQMQPLDARRLFPCFDQPEFKSKFILTVIHPKGTRAVGNTQLINSTIKSK